MSIKTIVNQLCLYDAHMVGGNLTNDRVKHNIKGVNSREPQDKVSFFFENIWKKAVISVKKRTIYQKENQNCCNISAYQRMTGSRCGRTIRSFRMDTD